MTSTERITCPDCLPEVTVRSGRGVNDSVRVVAMVGHTEGCPWLAGELLPGTNGLTVVDAQGAVLHYTDLGAHVATNSKAGKG